MSRSTILAGVLLALTACGTSPPTRYYALSELPATAIAKTGEVPVVVFGPFSVAEYLQRPQIVVRDAGNQLRMAEFDRWAAAPQAALVPWLATDVDRQLANGVVVAFPAIGHADAMYRVRGTISEWDTDASGTAVLVVQWECVKDERTVLVPLQTSRYTAQAQRSTTYGDIVSALNRTLEEFAHDVATAVSENLPQPAEH